MVLQFIKYLYCNIFQSATRGFLKSPEFYGDFFGNIGLLGNCLQRKMVLLGFAALIMIFVNIITVLKIAFTRKHIKEQ